jgi:predicted MFS family arabinose efflux permease
MPSTPTAPIRLQLVILTLARLTINIAHRMVYPFLPEFSQGLRVSRDDILFILSVRGGLSITAPLFSVLPDRLGRKPAMLVGLGAFSLGLLLVGLFANYALFFAALVLIMLAKFVFDPAMQAYLSERTPYSQRGLVIAFTELGWSGAYLMGVPLVGVLIAWAGWRAPFWPLALAGVAVGALLWLIIPRDLGRSSSAPLTGLGHLKALLSPVVVATIAIGLFTSAANECLQSVFGIWMKDSFGLSVVELGLTTIPIGLAELAGEGLVMGLADRLGKRHAIALGLGASALAYLAVPFLASHLSLALAGLVVVFIAFEFTIVATIPLATELLPHARGLMLTTNMAGHGAGRMLGVLLGGWLFHYGILWNSAAAVVLNLISLLLILLVVKERHA